MQIEKMSISNYEEVFELWKSTPGLGLNNLDDSKNGIYKYLQRNPNTCYIARNGQKLIGVILSGHDGRRGLIHHLCVAVSERKNGIGKALVNCALEALKKEGINKVIFVVFRDNIGGNIFWEKLGFTERPDLIYRNKSISEVELVRIETK